jgi:RNA polymerase sigma-70 factor, ECF subfamily
MSSEDLQLADRVRKDPDAIKSLYEKHAPALLSLCLRYCGNIEDAEDVLHDGFIKIIRHLHTFKQKENGSFLGWMKRIMVNTSLNYLRDRSKENRFLSIDPIIERIVNEEDDGADSLINPERFSQEMVMKMICELPAGYRTVFNMYVFEDYSHKEIAEALNCSENTSKSQLSKARAILRTKLNQVKITQTT